MEDDTNNSDNMPVRSTNSPPDVTQAEVGQTSQFNQAILDSLDDNIAILDNQGNIIAVNAAWQRFAAENGTGETFRTGIGINYLQVCREAKDESTAPDAAVADSIQAVIDGKQALYTHEYPCDSPSTRRWFLLRVTPLHGHHGKVVVSHTDITARKKAELETQRLGRILDSSSNEIFVFAADTLRFQQVNVGAQRNLGYTLHELRQMTPLDIKPHYTRETFEALLAPLRSGDKEQLIFTTEHRRKDGSCYPVEIRLQLSRTEREPSFVAIIQDISERLQAEQALRDSEKKFRQYADNIPSVLWLTSVEDGRVLYVSPAFEEIWGQPAQALYDNPMLWIEAIHAEDREPVGQAFAAFLAGEAEFDTHYRITDSHGNTRWINDRGFHIHDADGQLIRVGGVAMDITREKLHEEQRRWLATAMEAADEGIVLTNTEGKIQYVNPSFERFTGYSKTEVIGMNPRLLKSGAHDEAFYDKMWQTLARGETFRGTFVNRRKDGTLFDVDETITPILDESGQLQGYVAIERDVTAWMQAQNSLRRLNHALATLTACNQAMVHAEDEQTLLKGICEIIVRIGGYRMAWVGYAEHDTDSTVRPMAQAGFDDNYLDNVRISWADNEHGRGPTGSAIRTGRAQINRDSDKDPRFAPWRDDARQRGFASSIALPLRSEQETFGALSIYAAESDVFDPEETQLLTELADDLAYGIKALRIKKEHRQLLHHNELILNAAGEGIVGLDADSTITFINPAGASTLGWRVSELVGQRIHDVLHPRNQDGIPCPEDHNECAICNALQRELAQRAADDSFARRDGSLIPVEYIITPLHEHGQLSGAVMVFSDITARKLSEEELRRSEARLAEAQRIARLGNWEWNITDNSLFWSDEIYRMFGLWPNEFTPSYEAFLERVHPDDRADVQAALDEALQTNSHYSIDHRILLPDGSERIVREEAELFLNEPGEPARMVGTVQDVTERRRTENAIRSITESVAGVTGIEFFRTLVSHMANVLGVKFAFVGQYAEDRADTIEAVAVYNDGTIQENFSYALRGTPCATVVDKGLSVYPSQIRKLFPDDRMLADIEAESYIGIPLKDSKGCVHGVLAAVDSKPLDDIEYARSMLQIFSVRASGELERLEAERSLRESEERYALASRGANDGLWDWDIINQRIYYSPRWKAMLGYGEDDITNTPGEWLDRVHTDDIEDLDAELRHHWDGLTPLFEHEFRIRHRDGSYRWVLSSGLAVRDDSGKPYRMAGSMTDITERKQAEKQLLYDALHDSLTGLPNRTLLSDRLQLALEFAKRRHHYDCAVLFIDLDNFKVINDSLGHVSGDWIIMEVANKLQQCVRPGDTVSRLGGDEYVILLEGKATKKIAGKVAEQIQHTLTEPVTMEGHELIISASIGIAIGDNKYNRPEDILRDADTAMYQAKREGKARHCFFDKSMHTSVISRLTLETDLRRALKQNELFLQYQPIIDLLNNTVSGFEALVRWQHPGRGLISPVDFIPVAEETGLIIPIGKWILDEACRQIQAWQEQIPELNDAYVSVNISPRQFTDPDLLNKVENALQHSGLETRYLRLEITENAIMEDTAHATSVMSQLKDMGIQIYMDDFGTGYSSLSYLHSFPIDVLKMDRSFISRLLTDPKVTGIIQSTISLSQQLKINMVAEGIEQEAQGEWLQAMGVRYGQGYLYAKPLATNEVAGFVNQHVEKSS